MYREIVTKAIIGKGKISNNGEVLISEINDVSKLLGCWVINHCFVSSFENGKVFAKGKYDIHLWCGVNGDSDTIIYKKTVDYIEEFSLKLKDEEINENNEYVIKCAKYPSCNGLVLNEDGVISVKIEKELNLDIIGETTLKVQISSNKDEWISNEDIDNINVNYLNS